ncbi:MAG: O-antigen ligase family protein [Bacteroidia bacterium]|nr:O-antigen ligase family protein [Bacteroidia bacterium]
MTDSIRQLVNMLPIIGMLCIAIGLSLSHSLISIGVGTLLIGFIGHPSVRLALRNSSLSWRSLYLPFLFLYILHGLSWFYTTDKAQWVTEMRIKLPMLFLLPATVATWMSASEGEKKLIHLAFHLGLLIVGIGTLWRFFTNISWGLEEMRQGRYIPMVGGISHIYYAGLVGVGIFFLWTLPGFAALKWRLLLTGLHMLILHTLALRTGLAAGYGTILLMLIFWTFRKPARWIWTSLVVMAFGLGLVSMVKCFPPMKRRWYHVLDDLATYKPGGEITYSSIARRLAALEASWKAFWHSPFWGVGIADNQAAVFAEIPKLPYRWDKKAYILPHNQFVEYTLGFGIIGLSVFLVFWIKAAREPLGLFWVGWLIYWFLLMQVEAFLERQIGITSFLWGTGILWAQLTQSKS